MIVPVGQIPKEALNFLQMELPRWFSLDVKVARTESIPQYAFNPGRNQYHSTKILERLRELKMKDERILSVINTDLYVPELNFIFGETHFADKVCIIPLVRLLQEYYGLQNMKISFCCAP